ncbi:uncharacterized protein LOC143986977 [Lithobates pipiens]
MEPRAKLAAAFLGICFIFTAFPFVSSMRVYDPKKIMEQITKLLTDLTEELKHLANHPHFRVKGPSTTAWQGDINCTGSFLDVFTNGTKAISDKFSDNSVKNISDRISNCVEHLEKTDCKKLKDYRNETCGKEVHNQKVEHFLDQFLEFSESFHSRGICGQSFRQKYDRRRDDWPDIC